MSTKEERVMVKIDQIITLLNVALRTVDGSYLADKDSREIVHLLSIAKDELDSVGLVLDNMFADTKKTEE